MSLPPTLAAKPNIPIREATLKQVIAERYYWQSKLDAAPRWGAAVGAAAEFLEACNREIARRRNQP